MDLLGAARLWRPLGGKTRHQWSRAGVGWDYDGAQAACPSLLPAPSNALRSWGVGAAGDRGIVPIAGSRPACTSLLALLAS